MLVAWSRPDQVREIGRRSPHWNAVRLRVEDSLIALQQMALGTSKMCVVAHSSG
jgi:hypothetical protein